MSNGSQRSRVLIEYRSINHDSLKEVDAAISQYTGAGCWLLHDEDSWNAMVLVTAEKGRPITRYYFTRSALVNYLKQQGLSDYSKVSNERIDQVLETFIKRPGTKQLNFISDEQDEFFKETKGPQDGPSLAGMESQDVALLYKQLMDEACDYVRAGMTLKQFYDKYEKDKAKCNIVMRQSSSFINLWKNFEALKEIKKQEYSLEQAMKIYLDENPIPDDGTDYYELISRAGHKECLNSIYRVFFERKDPKKNLVWIYGAPNSGKTSLINHLETIFCCQEFNFQDKYCTTQNASKSDWEVQLMMSKEFEVDHAFSLANYTSMKRMCEGIGAPVSNNKYAEFKQQFVGKQFIIASNKLPKCSWQYHADHVEIWEPMLCRMEMVKLSKGFHGATDFPYSAAQLAAALTQMINRNFENQEAQERKPKGQEKIDLSYLLEEQSHKKIQEEYKQEETLAQAEEAGHMRSDAKEFPASQPSGFHSQDGIQKQTMTLSQPVQLGKRKNREKDNCDMDLVWESMTSYKTQRK